MKKLILSLIVLITATSMSFAQSSNEIASTKGAKELAVSKSSGEFVFTLPSNLTKEDIDKNSKYYTHYFTISFDESSHTATINMNDNTSKNRYVIARFLTACGVKYVTVDDVNLELSDFIEKHLK